MKDRTAHCRRCGSPLAATDTIEALPEWRGHVCAECGWRNLDDEPVALSLDLNVLLRHFPELSPVPSDVTNADEACDLLTRLRAGLVTRLQAEVRASPSDALTWLMTALDGLYESETELAANLPVLGVQQVYLTLVQNRPLIVFADPVDRLAPFWTEPVGVLLVACATLSTGLREAGLGVPLRVTRGRWWSACRRRRSGRPKSTPTSSLRGSRAVSSGSATTPWCGRSNGTSSSTPPWTDSSC